MNQMGADETRRAKELVALLSDNDFASELHSSTRKSLAYTFSHLDTDVMSPSALAGYLRGAFGMIYDDAYFPLPPDDDPLIVKVGQLYDELTDDERK